MSTGDRKLKRLYQVRFDTQQRQAKNLLWRVLVTEFFQRWANPDDVVLDLGCGFGEFLNHLSCGRKIGVDLNPEAADYLEPATEFHHGGITELDFLADGQVDLVFTSNVLEHLADKDQVEQTLAQAWRVLRPGGRFIALGPNLRFLPGKYWDFWDHLVPITDRSLCEVLQSRGFELERVFARFLPYTTCSSLPASPRLVSLYLRMPWAWGFLGKQFLVLAQKPPDLGAGS